LRELVFLLVDLVHGLFVQHSDDSLLGCEFLIKGTYIEDVFGQLRLVRRGNLSLKELGNVNRLEPGVLQNFLDTTFSSQAIGRILLEELRDEVFAFFTHVDLVAFRVREVDSTLLDHLVHLLVVVALSEEGWASNNHLVGKDTDGPPIDRERVTRVTQNFRS